MASTVDLLRRLAAEKPDDADLRLHLGELLVGEGQGDEALTHLLHALRLRPSETKAQRAAAHILHQKGRDKEAARHLEALGKGVPSDDLLRAKVFLALGETARAEEAYFLAVGADQGLRDDSLLESIQGGAKAAAYDLGEEDDPRSSFEAERPKVSFADVGGMEDVKEQFQMQIILPLQKPEMFRAYGKRVGGGVLLYGPPGCGKSYLARALAGQCNARFFMVGLHDILDKWIGQSERNVHELFEQARRLAPSIVFLDEIDVLGGKRGSEGMNAMRGTINQLLVEMDNLGDLEKPVLVVGATNTPWSIDTALKRPGRFDRIIFVPPPDAQAREAILKVHLRGKPADNVDTAKVAAKTERFSGADLRAVVDRAVEDALRRALRSGKTEHITTSSLLAAAKDLRPSTAEWLATARDYAKYSNEGGFYDPVSDYLR